MSPKPKRILFVCTGNTCRSPMAEAFFNQEAQRSGLPVTALSAGLSVFAPAPATFEAIMVARTLSGADLSAHASQAVSEELVRTADAVYGMTQRHVDVLQLMFSAYTPHIHRLGERDIPDPYGGTAEDYRRAARAIAREIARLLVSFHKEAR